MTDMDWADEIADGMVDGWEGSTVYDVPSPDRSQIASALRKAKADGLRRAADLTTSDEGCGDIDFIRFKLLLEAQDLEKTSTD